MSLLLNTVVVTVFGSMCDMSIYYLITKQEGKMRMDQLQILLIFSNALLFSNNQFKI